MKIGHGSPSLREANGVRESENATLTNPGPFLKQSADRGGGLKLERMTHMNTHEPQTAHTIQEQWCLTRKRCLEPRPTRPICIGIRSLLVNGSSSGLEGIFSCLLGPRYTTAGNFGQRFLQLSRFNAKTTLGATASPVAKRRRRCVESTNPPGPHNT